MPRERFSEEKLKKSGIKNILFPLSCGRMEYFTRGIVFTIIIYFPLLLLISLTNSSDSLLLSLMTLLFIVLFLFGALWIYVIPRLRDLGWSAWAAVLTFIPGVNVFMGLLLLFTPGKPIR